MAHLTSPRPRFPLAGVSPRYRCAAMDAPTTTAGHTSGLGWLNGWPIDSGEDVPELSWPLNVATYDRMHRGESQAKSVFNAVTMPIRRAPWAIDPNGAPDDVVKLVAGDLNLPVVGRDDLKPVALRRRKRFDFRRHIGAALMHLAYGHMPFEIVGEIGDDGLWHLRALEERMPSTLAKINVARNGDLVSLSQWPVGSPGEVVQFGVEIEMPAERLVMYVHERVGGLWQGQSIYRTSYRHYLVKDRLIRVDAMKHERNGMGIPWIEAPEGAPPNVIKDNEAIASRLRAGENVGGGLPYGSKLHIAGVEGSIPDTIPSIRYHDEMMGVETLTQFLQLGKTEHGSRALGDTLASFFILVLQSVADELADTFNEQLVEQWVDWNYGENVPAPRVVPGDIGSDTALTAEALAGLVQSGALQVDATVDTWIRDQFKLPPRPEGDPFTPRTPSPSDSLALAASRRPFGIRDHGAHHAQSVKENAPKWPGKSYLAKLVTYYEPRIADAIAAMGDARALAEGNVKLDTGPLAEVMRTMCEDAWLTGFHAGNVQCKPLVAAAGDGTIVDAVEGIDWSKWEPGDPDAAALLKADGTGLAALLDDAGITVKGIADTTLDLIGTELSRGLDEGLSVDKMARNITGLLGDRTRARTIAQTESARAQTVSTLDSYKAHGVRGKAWLLSDGACPLCEENEAEGVIAVSDEFPNGDPPVHPSCVCAVEPAIDA